MDEQHLAVELMRVGGECFVFVFPGARCARCVAVVVPYSVCSNQYKNNELMTTARTATFFGVCANLPLESGNKGCVLKKI